MALRFVVSMGQNLRQKKESARKGREGCEEKMERVLKWFLKFYGIEESPNKFFFSVSNPPVLSLFKTMLRFFFYVILFVVGFHLLLCYAFSVKPDFLLPLESVLLGAAFSLAISIDVYCFTTLMKDVENENFYFKLIEKIYNISIGSALFITINKSNTVEEADRLRKKIADCLNELTIIISYGASSSGKIPYEIIRTTENLKKDFDTAYCTKKYTDILNSIVNLSNVMYDAYKEDKKFCKNTEDYFVNLYNSIRDEKIFECICTNSSLPIPLEKSELKGVFKKFEHISPSLK